MTDQNAITALGDQEKMLDALKEIAMRSQEAEVVLIAMEALTNTEAGRSFLRTNPIIL